MRLILASGEICVDQQEHWISGSLASDLYGLAISLMEQSLASADRDT